jgi:hypothetical protein
MDESMSVTQPGMSCSSCLLSFFLMFFVIEHGLAALVVKRDLALHAAEAFFNPFCADAKAAARNPEASNAEIARTRTRLQG